MLFVHPSYPACCAGRSLPHLGSGGLLPLANWTVSTGSNYHNLLGLSRFLPPTSCGGLAGRYSQTKVLRIGDSSRLFQKPGGR